MIISHHAWQRWTQRCSGLSLRDELSAAVRPSKRIRRLIYSAMPNAALRTAEKGASYLVSPLGVVFVVANDTVITVFTLAMTKDRIRQTRMRCAS